MANQVSPMVHIEVVVRDAEAAYQFLHNVFGAEKVQEEFAGFLDSPRQRCIHVGLGNVILQFIQPVDLDELSWGQQLIKNGPGVHNLTFIVDDVRKVAGDLEKGGAPTLFTFPLDWAKLVGPENVRPDVQPVHMIGSMEKLGFHLELAEPITEEATLAETLAPPMVGKNLSPMLHIELVVNDVDETFELLNSVFGTELVELDFANFLDSPRMKIRHMLLGDVVLQYCQPLAEGGSWYEQLKNNGPGVHNITYILEDMNEMVSLMKAEGVEPLLTFPLDWSKLVPAENLREDIPNVHMMNTRELLGFHMEFGQRPSDLEVDFLHVKI